MRFPLRHRGLPIRLVACLVLLCSSTAAHAEEPTPSAAVEAADQGSLDLGMSLLVSGVVSPMTDGDGEEGLTTTMGIERASITLQGAKGAFSGLVQGTFVPFSAEVLEAYIAWTAADWLELQVGRTYVPFSLTGSVPITSMPTVLRPLYMGNPKDVRDIGLFAKGMIAQGGLQYGLAVVNGTREPLPETIDSPDVLARVVIEPFALLGIDGAGILHLGVSGRWGKGPSRHGFRGRFPDGFSYFAPPEMEGALFGFTGELAYWWKGFGITAEYLQTTGERDGVVGSDPLTGTLFESLEPVTVKGWHVGLEIPLWGEVGTKRAGFPYGTGPLLHEGGMLLVRYETLSISDGEGAGALVEDFEAKGGVGGLLVVYDSFRFQLQYYLYHLDPAEAAPTEGSAWGQGAVVQIGYSL